MADYRKMYNSLFSDVTDAISLLQRAQQKTEGIYVSGEDAVVREVRLGEAPVSPPAASEPPEMEK